ncbi:MAG: glutaredoxin 3 [Porticoccaceae bacterium]|nr:glutaredoxin 3 [Porticoccaceae bacterium]
MENFEDSSSVNVYGTKFCPYCIATRQLLDAKGVAYQYTAVDNDPNLRENVYRRSKQRTVPQIWIGEQHIGGFTDLRKLASNGDLDRLLSA